MAIDYLDWFKGSADMDRCGVGKSASSYFQWLFTAGKSFLVCLTAERDGERIAKYRNNWMLRNEDGKRNEDWGMEGYSAWRLILWQEERRMR